MIGLDIAEMFELRLVMIVKLGLQIVICLAVAVMLELGLDVIIKLG